jgi:hypothetical protein
MGSKMNFTSRENEASFIYLSKSMRIEKDNGGKDTQPGLKSEAPFEYNE